MARRTAAGPGSTQAESDRHEDTSALSQRGKEGEAIPGQTAGGRGGRVNRGREESKSEATIGRARANNRAKNESNKRKSKKLRLHGAGHHWKTVSRQLGKKKLGARRAVPRDELLGEKRGDASADPRMLGFWNKREAKHLAVEEQEGPTTRLAPGRTGSQTGCAEEHR